MTLQFDEQFDVITPYKGGLERIFLCRPLGAPKPNEKSLMIPAMDDRSASFQAAIQFACGNLSAGYTVKDVTDNICRLVPRVA